MGGGVLSKRPRLRNVVLKTFITSYFHYKKLCHHYILNSCNNYILFCEGYYT